MLQDEKIPKLKLAKVFFNFETYKEKDENSENNIMLSRVVSNKQTYKPLVTIFELFQTFIGKLCSWLKRFANPRMQ